MSQQVEDSAAAIFIPDDGSDYLAMTFDWGCPYRAHSLSGIFAISVTAAYVAELLAGRGVFLGARGVAEALGRLVERDILREVRGQPPRYEYKVELVRLWVERYKSLGRVVEEVG